MNHTAREACAIFTLAAIEDMASYVLSSDSNALASFRSAVSKPSVNTVTRLTLMSSRQESCMYRRPPTNPGLRLLDLRGDPNQQIFAAHRGY